jgi:hypothetical protein
VDLEAAGADRHLETVLGLAALRESGRNGRLGRPEETDRPVKARPRARDHALECGMGERVGPEPPQLSRRAGQSDGDAAVVLEEDRRRRPRDAEGDAARRQHRLLADARLEIGVRPPEAGGDLPPQPLDLALELRVDGESAPRRAGQELDRAVVVRRPEAAAHEADVRLDSLRERGGQELGAVADEDDARRL